MVLKSPDLFKKHELDLSTFASLNEADLAEIGVTAFGARRKMLLIIAGNLHYIITTRALICLIDPIRL